MEKKCPKCGNPIPEEAAFCLKCFYSIDAAKNKKERKKGKKPLLLWFKKNNKFNLKAVLIALVFLLIIGICISAIKKAKSAPKPQTTETTIIIEETYYVPVTEENGVAVTDENGEQVTDVVAVTKVQTVTASTTQKQGLFDKIFNFNSDSDDNNTSESFNENSTTGGTVVETTEKKGFFEQLIDSVLGDKDENSTTVKAPTEEHRTTNSTTTTSTVSTTIKPVTTVTPSTTIVTTLPPTTRPVTTTVTTPTTKPSSGTDSSVDFTYTEVEGKIKLIRYTGNASDIVVPSTIDGKNVTYLSENLFSNNSNIKTITFLGRTSGTGYFYLPHNTAVFNNLPNLTTITFPFETYNYFINSDGTKVTTSFTFDVLFTNCPKISAVNMSEKINTAYNNSLSRMRSFEGVVFTHTDSYPNCRLIWYPRAKTTAHYTLPDTANYIYKNAIMDNPYIESITFSKILYSVYNENFYNCTNLKSFSIPSGNNTFTSENGVLYVKGFLVNGVQYHNCIYPPAKTDSYFEFSSNYNAYIGGTCFRNNPYLKTLKLPPITRIDPNIISKKPPALEKLIIPQNVETAPTNLKDHFTVEYY
ncbi:MAG: leucine-rich repeat protein [Clostridia bacterium]|nr:leucine-rich repeat protein [Clostridia bacterium]